uniref:SIAH-type domain-containing protein n=1 Tax=Leersia perrieri TaxID=77586 RepID=A0A0D9WQ86_9ORYZ
MAKFSLDDADEDPPVASVGEKRKRDDGPAGDAAADGETPRALNSATTGEKPAVPGEEAIGRCGLAEEVEDGLSVQIDPDMLDCSICFESLRPPLYQDVDDTIASFAMFVASFAVPIQRDEGIAKWDWSLRLLGFGCNTKLSACKNGHVACFSCWAKLSNKCHVCSRDANFARNIALEKIVESIKSSCSYAKWGCCKFINYAQRDAHEEACLFAPLICPVSGCRYRGFTGHWSGHFLASHSSDVMRFIYSQPFDVNFEVSLPFLVLLGEDDHLFLLVNNSVTPLGHAFSVVCLRNGNQNWKFSYEIEATSRKKPENRLQVKAYVTNTKQWTGLYPVEAFLLVPYEFCNSTSIILSISIERCAVV